MPRFALRCVMSVVLQCCMMLIVQAQQPLDFNRDIRPILSENCLACHGMPTQPDAEAAGTYGPPLIAMSARYPDKAKLRAQIWNAMDFNPSTSMPPFGKHQVISEQELDKVVDFIYGL